MATLTGSQLEQLAMTAEGLASAVRDLERSVKDAVDRIAATDARQAALHLEDLAGVLRDVVR